jgi:Ring finger domain
MSPNDRREYVKNFLKTEVRKSTLTRLRCESNRCFSISLNDSRKPSFGQRFDDNDNAQEGSSSFVVTTSRRDIADVGESHQNCAICLERFEDGEDICSSQNPNCKNVFHLHCIFDWLLKSQACPCCRRDYLSIDIEGDSTA